MSITIKDVAKKVGVTPATVSMVINNKPRISAETRRRVFEAIEELEYIPHEGARNLVLKRRNVIGVVAPLFTSYFAMDALGGVEDAMRQTDYNMVLYHSSTLSKPDDSALARIARERKVDGLIAMKLPFSAKEQAQFKKSQMALVSLEIEIEGFDSVTVDNRQGARDAVRHLLSLGHQRIAIINGPEEDAALAERQAGYSLALKEAGLEGRLEHIIHVAQCSREDGAAAALHLMSLGQAPSAIFVAAGDICAGGVLAALRKQGVDVPKQVSVVGFDDLPFAELLEPALTTVKQPMAKMGFQALNLLKSAIAEGESHQPQRVLFEASLVLRQSSGPAA